MVDKKKLCCIIVLFFLVWITPFSVKGADEVQELRIYNWEDYISDGKDDEGNDTDEIANVIEEFEEYYEKTYGEKVNVKYVTYATNEIMLSTIETGRSQYDLICPSDYVIQKMIKKDMLEELDPRYPITNYEKYCSPYIKDLFSKNGWDKYGVCYMWGTMGFLYDPERVDHEDVTTWDVMWNSKYMYEITTKDSMRDTYVPAVAHLYKDELYELKIKYENGEITSSKYTEKITEILNRCDEDTIDLVGKELREMKNNIFGFEVDSGKTDIATGKITINFAWSGDAVYSMDFSEEDPINKELYYSVPEEGSNIWFDGWVMPKGANTKLAQRFMDFVCLPDIAVKNMEKIGYTSAIGGDEVLDMINDWYGVEDGEYEVDLSYFFGDTVSDERKSDGKIIVKTDTLGRQFSAQYPTIDVVTRCAIMKDFGDMNDTVMAMWQEFKTEKVYVFGVVIIAIVVFTFTGLALYNYRQKRVRNIRLRNKTKELLK